MHNDWFAGTDPIRCDLECCHGRALNAFTERPADVDRAAAHNMEVLSRLARECFARPADKRKDWFAQYLQDAEAAGTELGDRMGRRSSCPG